MKNWRFYVKLRCTIKEIPFKGIQALRKRGSQIYQLPLRKLAPTEMPMSCYAVICVILLSLFQILNMKVLNIYSTLCDSLQKIKASFMNTSSLFSYILFNSLENDVNSQSDSLSMCARINSSIIYFFKDNLI